MEKRSEYQNLKECRTYAVSYVCQITGEDSINKTFSRFDVGGTDLGIPMYNSNNDKMYVWFGDTFSDQGSFTGNWRSNVCLLSSDWDLSGGLHFDGALIDTEGRARAIIQGHQRDYYEMTKIPTGAIEVNGTLYMFYFSRYSWANPKKYSMNYGGCVKSEDDGETWERVYDISWIDHIEDPGEMHLGLPAAELKELVNKDVNNVPGGENIELEDHFGYYFTQIFPVDGKDGYVYILGLGGYREEGIKLGRVLKKNIESFESYEYFNGLDEAEKPIWLKGSKGCRIVCENPESFIVKDGCSENSLMYNEYLQKWVLGYRTEEGLVMRTADNIWGEYGEKMSILSRSEVKDLCPEGKQQISIYSNYMHEKWTEENGKVMYIVYSQYEPLYNSSLLRLEWD